MEPDFGCLAALVYGLVVLCLVLAAALIVLVVFS